MSSESVLDQDKFWNIIRYLVQLNQAKSFDDICSDLSISKRQLNSFTHFLREVDWDLECHGSGELRLLAPPEKELPKINIEFDLFEWLQFQACFPKISENEGKAFYMGVKEKLLEAEKVHSQHDLFGPAEKLDRLLDAGPQHIVGDDQAMLSDRALINDMVSFLEEAILEESSLKLGLGDGRQLSLFPRKVVFLEGELSLVGEGMRDNCLVNVEVSDIVSATETEKAWKKHFSRIEIEDFICSLRSVAENEVRLVLKIYSREHFNSNLKRHFFGNQCMFTNPEGDFIWAASIEPNAQIFSWLEELGSDVEILDPTDFKKDFLKYCEAKLKKLA